jgi:Ala-tRNA(Pro) deacylase
MPASPQDLFAALERLGITYETQHHPAVFTVEESKRLRGVLPGAHVKNLFVKDKKSRLFLISALEDTQVDLKRVHERIGGSGRVSFGSAELLREVLGIEPGSVTPFAAINDTQGRVTVVLDERLVRHERINVHPLVNTMTTGLHRDALLAFLRSTGHEPLVASLESKAPAEAGD